MSNVNVPLVALRLLIRDLHEADDEQRSDILCGSCLEVEDAYLLTARALLADPIPDEESGD